MGIRRLVQTIACLALALVMFHRLDGHALWVNPAAVSSVEGAGQLAYHTGTLLEVGGLPHVVREDVNQVIIKLREAVDAPAPTK
jgi:uncharacterized protein YlzI (FlbEa/FlbD family)